jgi:hypothetical protein
MANKIEKLLHLPSALQLSVATVPPQHEPGAPASVTARHRSTTCQRIGSCHHNYTCRRHHSKTSHGISARLAGSCVPSSRSDHMNRKRKLAINACFPE